MTSTSNRRSSSRATAWVHEWYKPMISTFSKVLASPVGDSQPELEPSSTRFFEVMAERGATYSTPRRKIKARTSKVARTSRRHSSTLTTVTRSASAASDSRMASASAPLSLFMCFTPLSMNRKSKMSALTVNGVDSNRKPPSRVNACCCAGSTSGLGVRAGTRGSLAPPSSWWDCMYAAMRTTALFARGHNMLAEISPSST
mmetsp:Transcript_57629/g.134197  ORF Transcript_57629/g.134197 Transcript_57629/m.134197 type:complete len:201 (+) Transcript_57629:708-1310(+)